MEVLSPRGAWTAQALARKGNPSRASVAQNMRFAPGLCYSREGTSAVTAVTGKVTSMFNWLAPNGFNYVFYQEGTSLKRFLQSGPQTLTMMTGLSQRAASMSDLGTRVYFCGYDTSGNGTIQARVHDGGVVGITPDVDLCFRGPLSFTASSAVDGGAGACTKGLHNIGFVFQSRTGFAGKPSPVVVGVFTPLSITLAAGARTINVSITLDTPADAGVNSAIYPIITRTDNETLYYFVPDNFAVLPASTVGWVQNFSISISDEDLATSATDASEQFNLLTVDSGGSGPFNPNFVLAYGRRMMYGVGNKVYGSAISDPQHITEDLSVRQMQNQRRIISAFPLGQYLYYLGDKWTGRDSDNGDDPATWPQPSTVSDSIGSPCPAGAEWRTAGNYAWVPSESGLYVFDGSYPERPITYLVNDIWARINWNAAYAIQIADDVTGIRCHVALPLDGATEPTHDLVVDYTNGLTFDSCDISLDNFNAATFSSIRMVKEYSTSRTALWIGPSASGNIVHLDPSTHNDSGVAIHPVWETSYVRNGELDSPMVRLGNANVWARGNGSLLQTWKGLDGTPSVQPAAITLSNTPGVEYLSKKDLAHVPNFTMRFETNAVDHWFQLSGVRSWMKPDLWVR